MAPTNGTDGAAHTQLRAFLAGLSFLTRIPVPRWLAYDPADLARGTAWFPVIGVVVGGAGAAVLALAALGWPPTVAAVLATVATVWLTGAFHEDALADACDGFGGGWEPAQVLAIMKDSRVGSYGVVGLALVLLAKIAALSTLAGTAVPLAARALIVGHALARWSSLPLIWGLPYVRDDGGKSRPFAASVTMPRLVAGTVATILVTAVALAPLGVAVGAVVLVAAAVVTALAARYFRQRLGGMTGDCLGAANQLVEVVTYLVLASTWVRA